MADHLTDEEQLQVLKSWWKENGTSLLLTIAIVAAAYFGWQWWNRYQQDYAEQASTLYVELVDSVSLPQGETLSDDKYTTAKFLVKQIQDEYSRSLYAYNASLLAAKLAVDKDDLDAAEEQLILAQEFADEDTLPIVSLRLARIYLAQEKLDDALGLVEYEADDSLTGLFASLRGDILVAKGDKQAARAAYQTALDTFGEANSLQKRMVEIKLSDLADGGQS